MSSFKMYDFHLKFDGYTKDVELYDIDDDKYGYQVVSKITMVGEKSPVSAMDFATDDFDLARAEFVETVRRIVLGLPLDSK